MIDVTYGILHYNPSRDEVATKAYIAAVESLANNRSVNLSNEVYLIDQGSQPELTESLARQNEFRAITLPKNVGISRGINLLANIARGKFVSLVTSDVIFSKGIDDTLVAALRVDPSIYQICPVSDNSALAHQRAQSATEDGKLIDHLVQELTIQFWPRKAFEDIGYFDERWMACYENLDFALRLFIAGGRIIVHQGAFCHHEHNTTTKNRAINQTYTGYISMPNGLDHHVLRTMWENKWPNLKSHLDIYGAFPTDPHQLRSVLLHRYSKNTYLPYIQEIGY
jgi:GT2 family glycosyltransferase